MVSKMFESLIFDCMMEMIYCWKQTTFQKISVDWEYDSYFEKEEEEEEEEEIKVKKKIAFGN